MPPESFIIKIADAIRKERKRRGLTQPQLAMAAGISERSLRQIEAAKETARMDIVARLLDALDLGLEIERNSRYSHAGPTGPPEASDRGSTGAASRTPPAGPTGPSHGLLGNAGRLQSRRGGR